MKITILLPHFKTPKISAYSVYQLLQNVGRHEVEIIVIDNNAGDGTIDCLKPFSDKIKVISYPKDIIQSHGVAFDFCLFHVKTDYFITVESDSFPINPEWLDYYETLIENGFECAGSLVNQAGGQFIHPCGCLYKKSVWEEAMRYYSNVEYEYFPNMAKKEGFDCHLMVHQRILNEFLKDPTKHIDLAEGYKPYSRENALARLAYYKPVSGVFHNGIGNLQESVKTYGLRNIQQDSPETILNDKENFIYRIGMEPGQDFTYWMLAMGKKVYAIPTEIFWMPNRVGQQQERSVMANGFTHIWGISAWKGSKNPEVMDIIKRKQLVEEELWESLPEKIKNPA